MIAQPRNVALIAFCIAALIAVLILRLTGPSDLYDQTQPKTIGYTTDIIVHGGSHWILPVERGELPATKPPLYNWLAVPGVKWLGFNSEIAHKLPSIAAMLVCWLLIIRLGRRIDCEQLGWLAAMMFVSSYAIFKLGHLARPDMLLMLWMFIAWIAATRVFVSIGCHAGTSKGATASDQRESAVRIDEGEGAQAPADQSRGTIQSRSPADSRTAVSLRSLAVAPAHPALIMIFWLAVALAGLTKGPAALVIVVYAFLAARLIAGRWGAIGRLHPILGVFFVTLVCGAWVYGVWRINPIHLKNELWFNEIYGRVTGTGREGAREGALVWLREMPYPAFYFVTRFLPWSIFALLAAWSMWRSRARTTLDQVALRHPTTIDAWMRAAAIFMLLTIGLFSLSVGKRSDYVAIAYPQTALLAAWWLQRASVRGFLLRFRLTPTTAAAAFAALSLALVSFYDHKQIWAPQPGFGDALRRFVDDSTDAIAARPASVMNVSAGQTHVQAVLGIAEDDQRREIGEAIARGAAFWVVAGRTQNPPREFDLWLRQRRFAAIAEAVVRSEELPRDAGWPGQVTLWRVTPD